MQALGDIRRWTSNMQTGQNTLLLKLISGDIQLSTKKNHAIYTAIVEEQAVLKTKSVLSSNTIELCQYPDTRKLIDLLNA